MRVVYNAVIAWDVCYDLNWIKIWENLLFWTFIKIYQNSRKKVMFTTWSYSNTKDSCVASFQWDIFLEESDIIGTSKQMLTLLVQGGALSYDLVNKMAERKLLRLQNGWNSCCCWCWWRSLVTPTCTWFGETTLNSRPFMLIIYHHQIGLWHWPLGFYYWTLSVLWPCWLTLTKTQIIHFIIVHQNGR